VRRSKLPGLVAQGYDPSGRNKVLEDACDMYWCWKILGRIREYSELSSGFMNSDGSGCIDLTLIGQVNVVLSEQHFQILDVHCFTRAALVIPVAFGHE